MFYFTICWQVVEVVSDKEVEQAVADDEAVVVPSRLVVDKVADDELHSLSSKHERLYPKLAGENY